MLSKYIEGGPEAGLVRLAQAGDRNAFDQLVIENGDKIYNLAFKLACNPQDAADLWQEVFLSAYRGLGKFRHNCSFSTWLYKIAANLWKNKLIDEKRHGLPYHVSLDEPAVTEDGETAMVFRDKSPTPEAVFENKQRQEMILEAVSGLNPGLKMAVVLCIMENKTYGEASEIMGCSCKSVDSKLNRAREMLRKKLSAQGV